jgi:hypothetical protein
VGQEITAEIRQSLDWLNMVSRDDVNFYATELELWRIDDSVPAPNFNVVCQPNMWARQLKMGQEEEVSADNAKSKNFPESSESKAKKEDSSKGQKEKAAAAPVKSGPTALVERPISSKVPRPKGGASRFVLVKQTNSCPGRLERHWGCLADCF